MLLLKSSPQHNCVIELYALGHFSSLHWGTLVSTYHFFIACTEGSSLPAQKVSLTAIALQLCAGCTAYR
jgi:hypothetical protein